MDPDQTDTDFQKIMGLVDPGVEEIVRFFYRPYLYLDDEKIAAAKLDRTMVEQAIVDALTDFDGIALAVATSRVS